MRNFWNRFMSFFSREDKPEIIRTGTPELGSEKRESAFENVKEARASFTVTGFEEDRIKVEFDWNRAFIDKVNELGFAAETEEDTVQLFFYASSMRPTAIANEIEDLSAPEVRLAQEGNRLVE